MWIYEKRLQFPVKITKTCPKTAQMIISQYGGPDGELSASMRYLSQRYTMPVKQVGGLLTDIGTEESVTCCYRLQFKKNQLISLGILGYIFNVKLVGSPPLAVFSVFKYSIFSKTSLSKEFFCTADNSVSNNSIIFSTFGIYCS